MKATPKLAEAHQALLLSVSSRQAALKVREVIKILMNDGWYMDRIRGSHRQYKHPDKPGLVTVAGKLSDDLSPGTLKSIFKQAGLR